jgi:hypothetical protein
MTFAGLFFARAGRLSVRFRWVIVPAWAAGTPDHSFTMYKLLLKMPFMGLRGTSAGGALGGTRRIS